MQYADGGSLKSRLEQQTKSKAPFSCELVGSWFAQMVRALAYMHSGRLMHRDIKPDNMVRDPRVAAPALMNFSCVPDEFPISTQQTFAHV